MSGTSKIFKFGGASVKDAAAARNVASIMKLFGNEDILIVVSAMGKTTNALEKLVDSYYNKKGDAGAIFDGIKKMHHGIMMELFADEAHPAFDEVNNLFVEIEWVLEEEPARSYDFIYDQVVSIGELVSSRIISNLLTASGIPCTWIDARDMICTDNNYREGNVDWPLTKQKTKEKVGSLPPGIKLTQGFIGSTSENYTTTLGREGSDYTAAILAYCVDASELVIWKDVPGVLNADPKYFSDAKKLGYVSYQDAIELAYYGASVIHPKTIQPLQNKQIPLRVKSFLSPTAEGTLVSSDTHTEPAIPSFIFKENQALISISAMDFSFIVEENLSGIFNCFATHKVRLNLMQNSAISFSVCVDDNHQKVDALLKELKQEFKVLYNDNLKLLTIRHYDEPTIEKLTGGKEILMEQRSRSTAQIVMRG